MTSKSIIFLIVSLVLWQLSDCQFANAPIGYATLNGGTTGKLQKYNKVFEIFL